MNCLFRSICFSAINRLIIGFFAVQFLSCGANGNIDPENEIYPKGVITVEPACYSSTTNFGNFSSYTSNSGYYFKADFKNTYEEFPYMYLYLITPDSVSFLPLELTKSKMSTGFGHSTLSYSCCVVPSTQVNSPVVYSVQDMIDFSKKPRSFGYLKPTSGIYKLVMLFKETPDFEEGRFISTKVIDLPEIILDYPCQITDGESQPKPDVKSFTITF